MIRQLTNEERFEMECEMDANFEAGTTVIDVMTGEKYVTKSEKKKQELTAEQQKDVDDLNDLLKNLIRNQIRR